MPCKHEAQYMYKTEKGTDLPTLCLLEFTVTTFLPSTPEVSTELSEHAAYISLPEAILQHQKCAEPSCGTGKWVKQLTFRK